MEAMKWSRQYSMAKDVEYSYFHPNHKKPLQADIAALYALGASDVSFPLAFHEDTQGLMAPSGDMLCIESPDDDDIKRAILNEVLTWDEVDEINNVPVSLFTADRELHFVRQIAQSPTMRLWFD